jgi:hypothetical protein
MPSGTIVPVAIQLDPIIHRTIISGSRMATFFRRQSFR